jgi:hypothetical protein
MIQRIYQIRWWNIGIPAEYALNQNYPNPFNPVTTISYGIPKAEFVTIKIYDILGREIRTLVNKEMNAGYYDIVFDAAKLASGVYFYRIEAGKFTRIKKLMLLK